MNAGNERFEVTAIYKFGNFYYAPGQLISPWSWKVDGSDMGRVMLSYRSSNFDKWSKAKATSFARPGQLTSTPIHGQQTHMGAGIWNRGNVLVGLYGMWQDAEKKPEDGRYWNKGVAVDLGLIVSNDGIHFREPVPDHKVIARGKKNEWDKTALLQGHAFVNVGDKTMMWYSHWDTGGKLQNMEIGLATMRRDGFGFLSRKVPNSSSHFVTTTFESQENIKLFANVEGVTSDAPLTIELHDEYDNPIAAFSGLNSGRISRSGTRTEVVWPTQQSGQLPSKQKFSVRVNFPDNGDAKVYAIYVGQ